MDENDMAAGAKEEAGANDVVGVSAAAEDSDSPSVSSGLMVEAPEVPSQRSTARPGWVLAGLLLVSLFALVLGVGAGRAIGGRGLQPEEIAATIASQPRAQVVTGAPDTAGIAMGVVKDGVATVGSPAPDFTLPSVAGGNISLSDYRGKPVLLNFFATWCMPCAAEMPHLQAAYEEHADEGLVVLAVDYQEPVSLAKPWLERMGLTFPAVADESGDTSWAKYEVGTLPTSVLIDRNGDVALIAEHFYASREELEKDLMFILPE